MLVLPFPQRVGAPPTGNPGSAPEYYNVNFVFSCAIRNQLEQLSLLSLKCNPLTPTNI